MNSIGYNGVVVVGCVVVDAGVAVGLRRDSRVGAADESVADIIAAVAVGKLVVDDDKLDVAVVGCALAVVIVQFDNGY